MKMIDGKPEYRNGLVSPAFLSRCCQHLETLANFSTLFCVFPVKKV